jgi:hypothetical protein
VIGLGAGTGSVFSLLPAQNATGNWIKVVQRVPVRIALDNQELDKHPLRIGLSSDVTVDITDDKGRCWHRRRRNSRSPQTDKVIRPGGQNQRRLTRKPKRSSAPTSAVPLATRARKLRRGIQNEPARGASSKPMAVTPDNARTPEAAARAPCWC